MRELEARASPYCLVTTSNRSQQQELKYLRSMWCTVDRNITLCQSTVRVAELILSGWSPVVTVERMPPLWPLKNGTGLGRYIDDNWHFRFAWFKAVSRYPAESETQVKKSSTAASSVMLSERKIGCYRVGTRLE